MLFATIILGLKQELRFCLTLVVAAGPIPNRAHQPMSGTRNAQLGARTSGISSSSSEPSYH